MVTEAQKRAKEKYMSSEKGKQGQKRWSEKYRSSGKGKHNLQRLRERQKMGRALTQQRELFGLTKEELALKLKLDVTLVEKLEAGTYYQIDEDTKTKNKIERFLQKLPSKLELPEELSESIVFLRKSFRKSQAWLSEQVGVSRQTISLWESGKVVPSAENVEKLEEVKMVELGNFLNNTLQGRMVCVLAICLAVYITATRKGSLEDQIKRLSSIAFYLTNVIVLASLLTLLGLLKYGFGSMVIVTGFILRVGMDVISFRLKEELTKRKVSQKLTEGRE